MGDRHVEALFCPGESETHVERLRTAGTGSIGPVHNIPSPAHDSLVCVQSSNLEHRLSHGLSAELRDEAVHLDLVAGANQAPTDIQPRRILLVEW
jgi:hypothetical protein